MVNQALSHIICPFLNTVLPWWIIARCGKKSICQERKNIYLKKQYLSFYISCFNLHYCMSPKPREQCTCTTVMSHVPCLFGNIITLCKKTPERYPKAPWRSQCISRHSLHKPLLHPWPTVQSFRCLFGVASCGKETQGNTASVWSALHKWSTSEVAMPLVVWFLFCGLSVALCRGS